MPSSIRVRAINHGSSTEVQALIQHPMDSGYLKDKAGQIIPAHFIETVHFEADGKPVLTALWGPAVSKNPYLKFSYAGGKKGDTLKITWQDNFGKSDTTDAKVL
jgi:sulfur-oxidizing protein SoxZ